VKTQMPYIGMIGKKGALSYVPAKNLILQRTIPTDKTYIFYLSVDSLRVATSVSFRNEIYLALLALVHCSELKGAPQICSIIWLTTNFLFTIGTSMHGQGK
jgi:hypothetical protein